MNRKEYRRQQVINVTLFPLMLMSTLQILSVSADQAPGTIPMVADLFARGFISLVTPVIAFSSIKRFIKSAREKNESRKFLFSKIFLLLALLLVIAFYPWTSKATDWWRIEVITFWIVVTSLLVVRWRESRILI
ncbi:MAG TPA: hypothetical protein VN132_14610 [Bdellovibrio sp.]|nr:hypothetical protein [Bdellovibrio sp.]